ncbi:MAG: alanine--tRNA ligase [Alphaproteobacteria bacterium]|nr:alanine--tRNA ligase [Alphaproteobacteria bacterium]
MASANEIRRSFLDYFAAHGHEVVASSPLVPHQDPTLLFTNAGMVQFKNVFTGAEHRPYRRAVTSQKCVRAGGKHNDLDNVGYTARHHTFFEMLGNFSFGDYFKDLAIELAWQLVTREFGLSAERLWVTVYAEDDEAFALWRRIGGLPEARIVRIATSDNFWSMGDTGPCGPCSEIFFDHGPAVAGGPPGSAEADGDRYVEVWNLVFMQFEQRAGGDRLPLPKPSIDTGMGLERIAAVLQGRHDNYRIDLLRALVEASAHATNSDPDGPHAASHKVVADHLRAGCFLIADGVMPANEGRGYVLRRILRRAVRHIHMLGHGEALLWRLVPVLKAQMGQAFPELARAEPLIVETLKLEESRFRQTLERGLRLLEEETGRLGQGQALPGEVAFRLYDTFGFPLDLTQDVLRAEGRPVDLEGFNAAMERQRAQARAHWTGSGEAATARIWFELRERHGASEFLGYAAEAAEARIVALLRAGQPVSSIAAGQDAIVLTNQTPFYGEAGGQMGDSGILRGAAGQLFVVEDTQKQLGDLILHHGKLQGGELRVGDTVSGLVDGLRRLRLRANHSATHLLHAALRKHLGEHVTQKGSLVAPDRLRFDISHPKPLSIEELLAVEAEANAQVRANVEVTTRLMAPEQAVKQGALALFGEKYGEEVRVVSMGTVAEHAYSTELCGGTHVRRTGDIGLFRILGEGAVAAGVRRIEAATGEAALAQVNEQERRLREAAGLLKAAPQELAERIGGLLEERRKLERELSQLRQRLATGGEGGAAPREVAGVRFLGQKLDDVPAKELRAMVDAVRQRLGSGIVALVAVADGKAALTVGVSPDLTARYDAVELVRAGAAVVGGKGGGGRRDLAQAGGPEAAQAEAALAAIEQAIRSTG